MEDEYDFEMLLQSSFYLYVLRRVIAKDSQVSNRATITVAVSEDDGGSFRSCSGQLLLGIDKGFV